MTYLFTLIQDFLNWLGIARQRAILLLLALTGLFSLILNAVPKTSSDSVTFTTALQSLALILFLVGSAIVVATRVEPGERRRAAIIILPAVVSLGLAVIFPRFWALFVPLGLGWVFIAFVASTARTRREYQAAIKHLRKDEFDEAIKIMSELIKDEPEIADHYRFRAELFRVAGKLRRGRADYEKVIALDPDSPIGYNGLAEVYLQEEEPLKALEYAQQAYQLEAGRGDWITPYNLGMIEDRLTRPAEAIPHLQEALNAKIPDSRHRLLVYLWLIRNLARLEQWADSENSLVALKREKAGLKEWETIFESSQAGVLKAILGADVSLARQLLNGELAVRDI
jgi:tetratricopeptide (TPR) repeat protein